MKINLSPVRSDDRLNLSREGDVLTVNGEIADFGFIGDGDVLPQREVPCDWLASDVTRKDGVLQLSIVLPHGANAPQETRFPEPISVTSDGPIALPPYDAEEVTE